MGLKWNESRRMIFEPLRATQDLKQGIKEEK
jgi:hypothetical protein